jgi:hypothetical protein
LYISGMGTPHGVKISRQAVVTLLLKSTPLQ